VLREELCHDHLGIDVVRDMSCLTEICVRAGPCVATAINLHQNHVGALLAIHVPEHDDGGGDLSLHPALAAIES
jgi:hypothetical protein